MTDLAECSGCLNLGLCCWMSVDMGTHQGRPIRIYSRVPCHKLDTSTGLCSDYENRLDVPWCRLAEDEEADKWPHFCPHHNVAEPGMVMAGRFWELMTKERSSSSREEFMKRIDEVVIRKIDDQFGIKLKPHLGSDYKNRQRLRAAGRSARKRGPRPPSRDGERR